MSDTDASAVEPSRCSYGAHYGESNTTDVFPYRTSAYTYNQTQTATDPGYAHRTPPVITPTGNVGQPADTFDRRSRGGPPAIIGEPVYTDPRHPEAPAITQPPPQVISIQSQPAAAAPVIKQNVNVSTAQAVSAGTTNVSREMDFGWLLFTLGWCLCGVPWVVAMFILFCGRGRTATNKSGYITCAVAACMFAGMALLMGLIVARSHNYKS